MVPSAFFGRSPCRPSPVAQAQQQARGLLPRIEHFLDHITSDPALGVVRLVVPGGKGKVEVAGFELGVGGVEWIEEAGAGGSYAVLSQRGATCKLCMDEVKVISMPSGPGREAVEFAGAEGEVLLRLQLEAGGGAAEAAWRAVRERYGEVQDIDNL